MLLHVQSLRVHSYGKVEGMLTQFCYFLTLTIPTESIWEHFTNFMVGNTAVIVQVL
jgi:hypothetical protein